MAKVTTNNTIPYIPSDLLGLVDRVEALEEKLKTFEGTKVRFQECSWEGSYHEITYTFDDITEIKTVLILAHRNGSSYGVPNNVLDVAHAYITAPERAVGLIMRGDVQRYFSFSGNTLTTSRPTSGGTQYNSGALAIVFGI